MKAVFKKSAVVTLVVLAFLAVNVTVFAAGKWVQAWQDDTLKIKYNGVNKTFSDPDDGSQIVPLVYNGRTYLPVRAIATLTGLGVDYDDNTHSVLLTSGNTSTSNNNTQGEKPYKDSESFNSVFESGVQGLSVDKIGEYKNSGTGTRRILLDDFKSLTQYGFNVEENLADDSKYGTQWVYFDIDLGNFSKEDQLRTILYNNLVKAAEDNGWEVKQTTSDKTYLYKDGIYLYMNNGSARLGLAASQSDMSFLMD